MELSVSGARAPRLSLHLEGFPDETFGFFIAPNLHVHDGQVAHRPQRIRVLGAQKSSPGLQNLMVKLLGLFQLTFSYVHVRQFIHGLERVHVLGSQCPYSELDRALGVLLRLRVETEILVGPCERVLQAPSDSRLASHIPPQGFPGRLENLPVEEVKRGFRRIYSREGRVKRGQIRSDLLFCFSATSACRDYTVVQVLPERASQRLRLQGAEHILKEQRDSL